jgi:general secretion pathway protein K
MPAGVNVVTGRDVKRTPLAQGFILLMVLWTVAGLALIGAHLTANGRESMRIAAMAVSTAQAEAAADGVFRTAAFLLLTGTAPAWVHGTAEAEIRVTAGHAWVWFENEAGKINPDVAQPELLVALLREAGANAGQSEDLAQRIVEWRFTGLLKPRNSNREAPYRDLHLPYGPSGAPFETLMELGLVAGMTPTLMARILPSLSLYNDAGPELASAGPVVTNALRALVRKEAVLVALPARIPGTITITARVLMDSGARFTRRAVVRLQAGAKRQPISVLTWDTVSDADDQAYQK